MSLGRALLTAATVLLAACPGDPPTPAVTADAVPDAATDTDTAPDLCGAVVCPPSPTPCAANVCDPTTGACLAENVAAGEPCERDADPCTIDTCDGNGFCRFDRFDLTRLSCEPPCNTDADCDDNDACTEDRCDATLGCVSTAVACPQQCLAPEMALNCGDVAPPFMAVERGLTDYPACADVPAMPGSEVVYTFTASDSGWIRVEVEATPVEYARVLVLEGTCAGDACSSAAVVDALGAELVVPVTGGQTYFIVVDSAVGGVLSVASVWLQCSPGETCTDTQDNDFDGLVDCADPDCNEDPSSVCQDLETSCDDGLDNDADGAVDCADASCDGFDGCELVEVSCGDGMDNDGDGQTDCQDVGCIAHASCITTCTSKAVVVGCNESSNAVGTSSASGSQYSCAPGYWPMGDGVVTFTPDVTGMATVTLDTSSPDAVLVLLEGDCDSGTCVGSWPIEPNHFFPVATFPVGAGNTYTLVVDANVTGALPGMGVNLGTVQIDCADGVPSETCETAEDCAKPACVGQLFCELVEVSCDDGQDNDGDGLTDCDDPHCAATASCDVACDLTQVVDIACDETVVDLGAETGVLDVSACTGMQTPGPEVVVRFTAPADTKASLVLSDAVNGATLTVHRDTCATSTCSAWPGALNSATTVTWVAATGQTFYAVVDRTLDVPWSGTSATLYCQPLAP